MKIVVIGLGYVGLSNAVLLAQHNEVIGVDISQERVDSVNARKSPIVDTELDMYLAEKDLNLKASTDLQTSVLGADYVIVSTPTNYNEKLAFFDTSSVEQVISEILKIEAGACIVVKSTVPVGFIDAVRARFKTDAVIFSPEFLREGKALYDNLYPSRIIVGEQSKRAKEFAQLLVTSAIKTDIDLLFTGTREAESIKLFANTFLAMRVAFFNELDSYALASGMNCREIIDGVSLDPRVGDYYNNPSFGYGGYCLPKDTKQLLANYSSIPQNLIGAIVASNSTRKDFLSNEIINKRPKTVGVYRLAMKAGSDNFRETAVHSLIESIHEVGIRVLIFEPSIGESKYMKAKVENDINLFVANSDIILANRITEEIQFARDKVFTRDLYGED